MSKIIEIKSLGLIGVEVPMDAINLRMGTMIGCIGFFYDKDEKWHFNGLPHESDYEIIGTIKPPIEFDFDASEYVENAMESYYMDYKESETVYGFSTPQESFISAIEAEGYYLSNPMGKEPKENKQLSSFNPILELEDYSSMWNLWHSYQAKTLTDGCKLLILKPTI